MRTVTFGAAASLDNYIACEDGRLDWLLWSDDVTSVMAAYWKTIDTVVMGRKTYEVAAKSGGGGSFPGVTGYVFSRTLKPPPDGSVNVVNEDAGEFVRRLKAQTGKGICVMGGGDLGRSLFEARVIDEVGINIHPVLLGSGVPLFHRLPTSINLELAECKPLQHGCVLLTYRVKRPAG